MWGSVKDVLSVPKSGVPSHVPGLGTLFVPKYGMCVIRCGCTSDVIH